ncbi:MFS transporter [Herbaspirillum sp. NPDC087042]|uniref:MFS transporter n=1 Tax=Herbaspirillum sp. NPDC087042 TaxID=3364004 RepID=UPI003819972D
MLFVVTTFNFADRAILSMAASSMRAQLGISPIELGYVFSAFSWAYVIGQLPGGWLLDRFGSRRVYAASIILWSSFTALQGTVEVLGPANLIAGLFVLRFLVGLAEAPSFPANGRLVAAWFPTAERGTASAIFSSAQYFAVVLFAPIMGWVIFHYGWQHVFLFMGGLGVLIGLAWLRVIDSPRKHRRIGQPEFDYIAAGGALVNMDHAPAQPQAKGQSDWRYLRQLLGNRMLLGVYLGQYCVNVLSYFFLTWFPIYLVQERGMSILKAGFIASLPAICGFIGGLLGGFVSDRLIRHGLTLTWARKIPIVAGLGLSSIMILANYTDSQWVVVGVMMIAFFGKGVGALGWAVVADTSPKEIIGLTGALFNCVGNIAGIVAPIIIGYLVAVKGSFTYALVFVGAHAALGVFSYLVIVPKIGRVVLKTGDQ